MTKPQNLSYSDSLSVELQTSYRECFLELDGDVPGRLAAQEYLDGSTAVYHGDVVGMGLLPKIYDNAAMQHFDDIVATTYSILDKVTQRYIADPTYRPLFGFSPLLEHLICLPTGYDCTIPITRIDIFLDETNGDFKFCEFNTDGSSAMNEDREVCNALTHSNVYQEFAKTHELCAQELFDNWVESFIDIYNSSSMAKPRPTIAILDYKGSSTPHEHREFCRRFELAGYRCLVVDMADLKWRDGELLANDVDNPAAEPVAIDAIYRRAVTFEILDELNARPAQFAVDILKGKAGHHKMRGAYALIQAVASGAVCLIGGFKTQVAHSKAIYCVLHQPQTSEFLSLEEQAFVGEHVPYTTWLRGDYIDLTSVKAEKDRWIIKPEDGYGTVGVFAGKALEQQEWDALIDEHGSSSGGYIIQEYCSQFKSLNTLPVPFDEQNPSELQPYNILTGLFCYAGRFRGSYVRSGQHALIVGFHGGITVASLLADFDPNPDLAVVPRAI